MTKLDRAIATLEKARTEPERKQDLVAEAVILTVRQVQEYDDLGLEELSQRLSAHAEAKDLNETEARKIAWGNG
jgi:hypothetical protein